MMAMIRSCCRGPKLEKDGGYAWVIVICAFFTFSLTTEFILSTAGNLTIAHKEFFNISLQQSSSIGSVCTGMFFLFGPVASVILKFTKSRLLQIIGGSCMVLGLGLSTASSKPWHAYLSYGILTAVGSSCCLLATSRILAEHFNRRLNLALSLASMGIYAGMTTWPVATEKLFSTFGYSKAMGILASVLTVTIVAGTLYFEPTQEQVDGNEKESASLETEVSSSSQTKYSANTGHQYTNEAITCDDDDLESQKSEKINDGSLSQGAYQDGSLSQGTYQDGSLSQGTYQDGSLSQVSSMDVRNCQDVKEDTKGGSLAAEIVNLLRSPKTWMVFVNYLLWQGNISSYFILVNNYILDRTGATTEEVALGITILGIGSFIGCLVVISISGRKFDRMIIHFICPLVFGVATIVSAFVNSKEAFYVVAAIWGMAQSSTIANMFSMLHGLGEPEQFTLLLGVGFFGEGIGGLCATPLIGVITQASTDQVGIIFSGLLGICSSFIVLPLLILNCKKQCTTPAEDLTES